MRLTKLLSAFVLATASSLLASAAMAEPDPSRYEPIRLVPVNEAFNRAFFRESGDYYYSRTIPSQIQYIIGPGLPGRATFPDLVLERDAERINELYNDVLDQQVSSDPVIRTPDLANPFNASLRLQPGAARVGSRVEGSEFIFETLPPR